MFGKNKGKRPNKTRSLKKIDKMSKNTLCKFHKNNKQNRRENSQKRSIF